MHFIRKLLNLVSFRRPRANSVEPTEFRETSAGRICCSLECRYPAVSHPFSSFLLPRPNRQFSIFSSQNLGNSWIFLFSSDIFFFLFFYEAPFRVQRHRYEFSTGTNGIKDFAFVALYNATNNDNRCLTSNALPKKGGYRRLLTMHPSPIRPTFFVNNASSPPA